ncbi:hypothetical protein PR002_g9179 [Phytophthora rubi]|uniref:Uncharacterized protein n=1 Tax=Phytophthora rubi TaxID=129364 RepID=A0A6A3MUB4_9STRA|nr:hypothetical protein PR002_g9179 [Phytophthora rubi]
MENAEVPVDVVEPVINDKHTEQATEVVPITSDNNHNLAESINHVKVAEPELVLHALTEENRPADVPVTPRTNNVGDATPAVMSGRLASSHTSHVSEGGAEVVTPAGTVEAPPCEVDNPTEVVKKEADVIASESSLPAVPVVETDSKTTESSEDCKVEQSLDKPEHHVELKTEPAIEHEVEQCEVVTPVVSAPAISEVVSSSTTAITATTPATEPTSTEAPAPSPGKRAKKQNESFVSEEVLAEVQKLLTLQIAENKCSPNSKEIHEFVEKHLNEKQRKRYVVPLVEQIVQHFTQEAADKSGEISVDVQSNICLIEQMFLTLGRRSPLQDMYTAEEEEMLDLLFHSNSSDNLPIDI